MKIGLIADIHGNADALEAVLRDASECGVSEFLVAGDLVGYYYDIEHVLELLKSWKWHAVRGNHEEMLKLWRREIQHERLYEKYGSGFSVTCKKLTAEQLDFLENLPHPQELLKCGKRVLLCHGAPWSVEEYVYPDASSAKKECMAEGGHDIVVFGHTHYPVLWNIGNVTVVNPGSVGQPRDYGLSASWAIWVVHTNRVEFRRVPYDPSKVIKSCELYDRHLPYLTEVLTRTKMGNR